MSEEALYCTNHPQRGTVLRCGKCERPMCTDCLIHTPVGLRCRQCANIRPSPIYDVKAGRLLLATAAGLAVAVVAGMVVFAFVRPFALWLSWAYGLLVGEAVSAAANRKRGPNLQLITIASIIVGAVAGKYWPLILAAFAPAGAGGYAWTLLANSAGSDLMLMIFAAVAVVVGMTRVR